MEPPTSGMSSHMGPPSRKLKRLGSGTNQISRGGTGDLQHGDGGGPQVPMGGIRSVSERQRLETSKNLAKGGEERQHASHELKRPSHFAINPETIKQAQQSPLYREIKHYCALIVDSTYFNILTVILTFYCLFGDDIRLALTNKPADFTFDIMTVFALIVFSVEIIIASTGKEHYFMSFFFKLDVIATASIFLDITSVAEAAFSNDENAAKTGQNTQAGARASKVVRIIRLVRLIRIVKLYKLSLEARRRRELARVDPGNELLLLAQDVENISPEDEKRVRESRVGKQLTDKTVRRVIVLVLSMLLGLPLFTPTQWGERMPSSAQYGADMVYERWLDLAHNLNSDMSYANGNSFTFDDLSPTTKSKFGGHIIGDKAAGSSKRRTTERDDDIGHTKSSSTRQTPFDEKREEERVALEKEVESRRELFLTEEKRFSSVADKSKSMLRRESGEIVFDDGTTDNVETMNSQSKNAEARSITNSNRAGTKNSKGESEHADSQNQRHLSSTQKKVSIASYLQFLREDYEETLLRLLYYHNPHYTDCPNTTCPDFYYSHMYWIGYKSGSSLSYKLADYPSNHAGSTFGDGRKKILAQLDVTAFGEHANVKLDGTSNPIGTTSLTDKARQQSNHYYEDTNVASSDYYNVNTVVTSDPMRYALTPNLQSFTFAHKNGKNEQMIRAPWMRADVYDVGAYPDKAFQLLRSPWTNACKLAGLSLKMDFGIQLGPYIKDNPECPEDLRYNERVTIVPQSTNTDESNMYGLFIFVFDKRQFTRTEAVLSTIQTIFICLVLAIAAFAFNRDANTLVVAPIESMIAKMERIRDNPLEAIKLGDEEYAREMLNKVQKRAKEAQRIADDEARRNQSLPLATKIRLNLMSKVRSCVRYVQKGGSQQQRKEPMETVILEKTIIKLGALLVLGFGEAGAEIIGQNMKGSDAGVNALVPGSKIEGVFGFCGIRHFDLATQVLQDKVMLYLNQICEILHGCVDSYLGAPNRNTGNSFLFVWRLSGLRFPKVRKTADMAVYAFLEIIAAITQSPDLSEYQTHPGFQQRIHNYKVSLGFGLHSGWAIEGAIGSELKIDASYLSPNVNMASRLEEAATEQYNCSILMSHLLAELCNKEVLSHFRLIDHVLEKGATQPIRLYTVDCDPAILRIVWKNRDNFVKNKYECRKIREMEKKTFRESSDLVMTEKFSNGEPFLQMRKRYPREFFDQWTSAYECYERGEWPEARDGFNLTLTRPNLPDDGPSQCLLDFMKKFEFKAPGMWPGYREVILSEN